MRPARDPDDFCRGPTGSFLVGHGFLYACPRADLFAQVYWGHPSADDARTLRCAYRAEVAPGAARHASLVDGARLEHVDRAALAEIVEFLGEHRDRLGVVLSRQAIVRASGLAGMVLAGFYEIVQAPYPVRVFEDRGAALAWLGAADLAGELARLEEEISGADPVLVAVRRELAAHPAGASLAAAARRLGTSERTLQRRLERARTSFRAEVQHARVRAAQARLLESDDKLTAIALDLGYGSLQQFSSAFALLVGEPPSRWRARQRERPRG